MGQFDSWDAAPVYAGVRLEGPRSGFAFMQLRQGKRGRSVPETVVVRDTEGEQALRGRGRDWPAGNAV